jgi:hypothetical protein
MTAMSDNGNLANDSEASPKQPANILQLLEYVTVLGSVAGTVAAFVTKQAVLAAAPMSASLFLNLINRRRIEQANLQNTQAASSQMQLVSEHLGRLQSQIPLGLIPPGAEVTEGLTPEMESAITAIQNAVDNLSQRLGLLETAPQAVGFGLDSEPSALFNADQFNVEFERRIDPLEQKFDALAAYLEQGTPAPATEADSAAVEMLKLQMQVQYTDLEASVNHVLEQLQQLPPANHLEQWAASLSELTHTVESYQQRLADLELSGVNRDAKTEEDVTDVQMDLSAVNRQVQSLLGPLEEKIHQLEAHASTQAAKPAIEPSELTALKAHIDSLTNQLTAQQLVQSAPSSVSEAETQELRQIAAQLETSLSRLDEKVEQVSTALPAALAAQPQTAGQLGDLGKFEQHLKSLELKLDMGLAHLGEELKQVQQANTTQSAQPQISFSSAFNETAEVSDDLSSLDDLLRELETR